MRLITRYLLILPLMFLYSSLTGAGQTIEEWGKMHFLAHGQAEGRALSASQDYGQYVRHYSDLLEAYTKSTEVNQDKNRQAIELWGQSHYQQFGKAEGRSIPPAGNFGDYVRSYTDLYVAYRLTLATENLDQTFNSCYYAVPTLTCAGNAGGILRCTLIGKRNVNCVVVGLGGESFNSCSLIGRGVTCAGNKGGRLNCKVVGRGIVCEYDSR